MKIHNVEHNTKTWKINYTQLQSFTLLDESNTIHLQERNHFPKKQTTILSSQQNKHIYIFMSHLPSKTFTKTIKPRHIFSFQYAFLCFSPAADASS